MIKQEIEVEVYGGDHSPWVQAVLLALHEKSIEHRLCKIPPFEALKQWGVLQPAVSINGAPWEIESSRIIASLGYDPISKEDLKSVRRSLQGVLHRFDRPMYFYARFSRMRDTPSSFISCCVRNFLHSFIAFYMSVMICFFNFKYKPKDPKNFGDQFLKWERELASSADPYLDGSSPGIRDFLLFGVVQCHASIPTPPLEALRYDDRLTLVGKWIGNMQERFRDYPHLYSGRYFESHLPQPVSENALQRSMFFIGLFTTFVLLPLTLPFAFFLMKKVPR